MEVIIGSQSIEYYFWFIMTELKNHYKVVVKVRDTTDVIDNYLIDDTFNTLFKDIMEKKKNICDGTIELIKLLQDRVVLIKKQNVHEMVPIFFNRTEKAKYLISLIRSFGVDLIKHEENIIIESRKGDKFTGSVWNLELWHNLRRNGK